MKKIVVLLLSGAILLSACGNAQAVSSSSQIPSSSAPPSSSEASGVPAPSSESSGGRDEPESQTNSSKGIVSTFGISIDDFAKALQDDFSNSDLPNAFDAEPVVEEDDSETLGEVITYTYPVVEGMDCSLYANKESNELFQIFVYASVEKMNPDSMKVLGGYLSRLIHGLEQDESQLAKIDRELNIMAADLSQDTINMSSGTLADFTYIINNGEVMLMISPSV